MTLVTMGTDDRSGIARRMAKVVPHAADRWGVARLFTPGRGSRVGVTMGTHC